MLESVTHCGRVGASCDGHAERHSVWRSLSSGLSDSRGDAAGTQVRGCTATRFTEGGISRRRLRRRGATAAGVLALGGTAVTPGAAAPVVGDHHFVSADGVEDERLEVPDVEPAPVLEPDDPIVERRLGNPIDDGTAPVDLEGGSL